MSKVNEYKRKTKNVYSLYLDYRVNTSCKTSTGKFDPNSDH